MEYLLPESVRGLVFDCDGTLLDTMSSHWASWQAACEKFGLLMTSEDFLGFAGKPGPEIVDILVRQQELTDFNCDGFIAFKRQHFEASISQVETIAPVVAIAEEGKRRGLPMAVASGGSRKHVIAGLRVSGLEAMFSAFVCAEDYEHSKPAPDCFLEAARQIHVAPEHCAGYEDADFGMDAIRAAGFAAAIDVRHITGYPILRQ